ncbi:MAG: TolC family protein [Pirellulales bacterium]
MSKPRLPLTLLVATSVLLSGCLVVHPPCEIDPEHDFYRTVADTPRPSNCEPVNGQLPLSTQAPLTIDESAPPPPWELSLADAVRIGLENSKVLRDLGGSVLRTPQLAQTIHDPAIQASDPRFGMEGALAAFDAQLTTSLMAYHNDRAFNNLFLGGGTFLFRQDLDNFVTELAKTTATGARFAVRQHIDYDANNALANVFHSYYNVNFETEFRQPLLQGAGVEFNRIAGPNGTPGQINGVVIARINNDISTAWFEIALRDYISNVENAYWDLYYAYRELDAKIAARDESLKTWRIIQANVQEGRGYSKLQEVQALEQYYHFQEEVLDALGGRNVDRTRTYNGSSGGTFRGVGGVQAAERRLRMWMGVPINDGKLIRPTDEPPSVKVVHDWCQLAEEALARRPELRRQQAEVERRDMELVASRNFLLPRLDIVGLYRWRGYGHDLIGAWDGMMPYDNAFANLTSGQFQEWELGFQYNMPIGFRREYAAVRNAQFQVARERAILEEQERQAIHDLSAAIADVTRAYDVMQVAYNRLKAAEDQYGRAKDGFFELGGKVSLELVLDARLRFADSETSFHRSRIDYAVALKNVHFEKGSLLDYNGAVLADGHVWQGAQADIARKKILAGEMPDLNYGIAERDRSLGERLPTGKPPASKTPGEPTLRPVNFLEVLPVESNSPRSQTALPPMSPQASALPASSDGVQPAGWTLLPSAQQSTALMPESQALWSAPHTEASTTAPQPVETPAPQVAAPRVQSNALQSVFGGSELGEP